MKSKSNCHKFKLNTKKDIKEYAIQRIVYCLILFILILFMWLSDISIYSKFLTTIIAMLLFIILWFGVGLSGI